MLLLGGGCCSLLIAIGWVDCCWLVLLVLVTIDVCGVVVGCCVCWLLLVVSVRGVVSIGVIALACCCC